MAKNFLGAIPLLVVGALAGMLPKVSLGAVIQVCHGGCPHSTIQGAVNAAASGDTILLSGEVYSERVTIEGKSLTIEGTPTTVVQGVGNDGPVFALGAGSGPYYEVDLSYLTVTGGDHPQGSGSGVGGGIQVRVGAYLHLTNVTVTNNSAEYGAGIGVMTSGGPKSTLTQCSITSNSATSGGGGIYVGDGASVDVQQCSISSNSARETGGGIDAEQDSTLSITGSTVSGNQVQGLCYYGCTTGYGGGLFVLGNLTVWNSTISSNSALGGYAGYGGGIYVLLGGNVLIAQSIIAQNANFNAPGGGGIQADSYSVAAQLTLEDDYIVLNETGGIENRGTLVPEGNTTIANNYLPNCTGVGCPP